MTIKKLIGRTLTAAGLSLALVGNAGAVEILLFQDSYPAGTGVTHLALAQLGETATLTSHGSFTTDLASQAWDLVIVDVPGSGISAASTAALAAYIGSGGRSILSYWLLNADAALQAAFDVTVASSFNSPMPVFLWDTAHPLFNSPSVVSDIVDFTDLAGDDGDKLDPVSGTALAGFTAAPAAGEAAIVLGNGGRTIVNGFLFWDMGCGGGVCVVSQNNIDLVANEISLLAGLGAPVPEPATVALLGLGLAGFGFAGTRRRR